MKNLLCILSVCLSFSLCACKTPEEVVFDDIYIVEAPQDEDVVSLQNLKTREIVHCRASLQHTSDECAKAFESMGYVRFKNIPTQAAEYDSLRTNTYPSRRWREGEKNPRW